MKKVQKLKTKSDFYKFFQSIPTDKWARNALCSHGRHCALGHLGVRKSNEDEFEYTSTGKAFAKLGGSLSELIDANDCGYFADLELDDEAEVPNRTIKDSVLAYIKNL